MPVMRRLSLVLILASTTQCRNITFINNCAEKTQVVSQSRSGGGTEVAALEAGERSTLSLPANPLLERLVYTSGSNGLTEAIITNFIFDRYEINVERGFDVGVRIESEAGPQYTLTCGNANCAENPDYPGRILISFSYSFDWCITSSVGIRTLAPTLQTTTNRLQHQSSKSVRCPLRTRFWSTQLGENATLDQTPLID
ncbi:hypothetical protein PENTCL1PPCAC_21582, partial [Pristionchus entomophagus]